MAEWMQKTALEMAEALRAGEVTSTQLVEESLARIDAMNPTVNAFVAVDRDGALEVAAEVDRIRSEGGDLHPMAGVPVAVKDNIVTEGLETTCASNMLKGWVPPYDATVVQRLKAAKLPIVGKTNLDEFAMGSSTETSAFGATHNPWDLDRTPGGSSGGAAAAVASYMVPFALGTDTGGSIRQPAAFTGTVGVKPTYGRVSRYGAVALASSMDQVGPIARDVADAAALQAIVGGYDPLDSTSLKDDVDVEEAVAESEGVLEGLRVGVVQELGGDGYQREVLDALEDALTVLKDEGAKVVEVSVPSAPLALPAYYLVMPAEAYSNLGRFDGVRFGNRVTPEGDPTAREMTCETRGVGFGTEVKRRIVLGAHVLSSDVFEGGYGAADKVRTVLMDDFGKVFDEVDVLISPTTPVTAFKLGTQLEPVEMYLNDVATVPANMTGGPAISIPSGIDDEGLPTSIQFFAPVGADEQLYKVAAATERALADRVVDSPYSPVEVGSARGNETQEGDA